MVRLASLPHRTACLSMLSLFSIPKPFAGNIARLQRNAIGSWRACAPDADIILLGDDDGVADCARAYGAAYIPDVKRNAWGTPRVDDCFERAEQAARFDLICYINADILLTRSFFDAVAVLYKLRAPFLAVCQRWDMEVEATLDFNDPHWEQRLLQETRARGLLHSLSGIDFFLARKGFWKAIPPFGVGRTMWDNWFVYDARARGAMVIDATPSMRIIHQNHDYGHHPAGWQGVWEGPEAVYNQKLAGGIKHYFTIEDATHWLTAEGVRPIIRPDRIRRRLQQLPVLNPIAARCVSLTEEVRDAIYLIRVRVARWRGRIPPAPNKPERVQTPDTTKRLP
jgi:hypothetical protein